MSGQFWVVWAENGGTPVVQHPNEASATFEAERLARLNPDRRFYVLEAIGLRCRGDAAMTAPLDLTKPIMLPHDKKPWRVVYCDDASVLVEGGSLNARAHHARQYIDEYAENIPPEPPRGPEEVWVSVYHNGFVTWTACASEGAALDMIACVNPARAGAAVRYIRVDLATTNAAREVRPLTDEECDDLLTKFERGGLGYFKVRPWYEKIMAARGIEVGE